MATYLLTWNPKKWDWDYLEDSIEELRIKGFYVDRWSTGVSKSIHVNDRIFLIRLGQEPRGIMASGSAESDVYQADHWDKDLYKARRAANYIDVRFDVLLNPEREMILLRSALNIGLLGKVHWDSQSSGIRIRDDAANELEELWAYFLNHERKPLPIAEPSAIEGMKTETVMYVRGRSRYLRDLALKESNGTCCVCEVDFSKVLNGAGVRVLQVHHRKQLGASDSPRVTRLNELAVVCANCHLLIHSNPKKALSIETLKRRLRG